MILNTYIYTSKVRLLKLHFFIVYFISKKLRSNVAMLRFNTGNHRNILLMHLFAQIIYGIPQIKRRLV